MVDRLSWLALIAAITFSVAIIMLGSGPQAGERFSASPVDPAPACTAALC